MSSPVSYVSPADAWPAHAAIGQDISVLPRIFEEAVNIAIFERPMPAEIALSAQAQCRTERAWQYSWLGQPDDAMVADLLRQLPAPEAAKPLVDDIATIAEAMAFLFETRTVGLRLRLFDGAMCPRFHCDNLPVRLVTTYVGPGSEWLPEDAINRKGLGAPHPDKPEIATDSAAVRRLSPGDIGLIKGSGWIGSEERGLVHRSPALESGSKRLLMSIDPA
ncbi:DUF1826 domain-containing protein [Halomonas sp. DSH1-27]|nr:MULTISPECIES: DUF1826 domain-containing protein [unclassified Halomonas]MCG7575710.1 DUF1826 domain-containing protein [Halomonas sp. MMH1-48]MCG7602772.1 DUF1826 domain-containing protein [Halomonas sp. MM17-34]MCG7612189.1 DUF1826 domain-containing protein [Halomonas sp. MM17-29]MCG7619070.1 DUF1826 domain-containing protein [Halomonas sp. DSH1-27]